MPKPKQSNKKSNKTVSKTVSKKTANPMSKKEMLKYESDLYNKNVLCLSDSDYDEPTEQLGIYEKTFYKNLDNGLKNYDSDHNDDIVREFNDTESLASTDKYDSDDSSDYKKKSEKSRVSNQ